MRTQPKNRDRRKAGRWRRAGILAAAGLFALAGCNSLDSGTTASAPDPFLGPAVAAPPKTALAAVQPPPGLPPKTNVGVLPEVTAPTSAVNVAALAPNSVRPTGDRDELRMASSGATQSGTGWTPTGGTSVASNGVKATLAQPDTNATPTRTPAPTVLTQNTNPAPVTQPVALPPPPQSQPQTQAATSTSQDTSPRSAPEDVPTTTDAAAAILNRKGTIWQRPSPIGETGEVLFRCGILNPKTNKIRVYEARAKDQLSAMQAVIDQIDKGQ